MKIPILNDSGQKIEIKIEILYVDNENVCVDFTKIEGDYLTFIEQYNLIKNYLCNQIDATIWNTKSEFIYLK